MRLSALAIVIMLSLGCQKKDGCVNLSQYHQLFVTGSRSKFIADSEGAYFLGPSIYAIQNTDGYTFGINPNVSGRNLNNVAGYFILHPNGDYYIGLTEREFETLAKKFGFSDIKLDKGPSSLLDWDNLQACDSAREWASGGN